MRYSHEDLVSRSIKFSKEPVQFVTLHPLELPEGNDFKIGFRMTRTMISGSETVSGMYVHVCVGGCVGME